MRGCIIAEIGSTSQMKRTLMNPQNKKDPRVKMLRRINRLKDISEEKSSVEQSQTCSFLLYGTLADAMEETNQTQEFDFA